MSKTCGAQSPTSCLLCRLFNKISHDTRIWFEILNCNEMYYNAPMYKSNYKKKKVNNERNSDTDTDFTCFPKPSWNTVQCFCNVSLISVQCILTFHVKTQTKYNETWFSLGF